MSPQQMRESPSGAGTKLGQSPASRLLRDLARLLLSAAFGPPGGVATVEGAWHACVCTHAH